MPLDTKYRVKLEPTKPAAPVISIGCFKIKLIKVIYLIKYKIYYLNIKYY